MKKYFVFLLCLLLMITTTGVNHFVLAEEIDLSNSLVIETDAQSLQVGDTVSVKIYVKEIDISYFSCYVDYDTEIFAQLTRNDIIVPEQLRMDEDYGSWMKTLDLDAGNKVSVSEASGTSYVIPNNGLLATLNFTVIREASFAEFSFTTPEIVTEFVTNGIEDYTYEDITISVTNQGNIFSFSTNSVEVLANEEVELPLNINTNPGFNALGITITFDNTICNYSDLIIGDNFSSQIDLHSIYEVPGEGIVKASFIATDDVLAVGTFATFNFTVKDGVLAGNICDIAIEIEQITNKAETELPANKAVETTITVIEEEEEDDTTGDDNDNSNTEEEIEYTLGDVNEDGIINLTDAIYILLNYNGEKILSSAQSLAGDINNDQTVNLTDALQILKYFNGEITTF